MTAKTAIKPLTEAELLRMPAKDYMNERQLDFFRHHLTAMREELLSKAAATAVSLQHLEATSDPADRATIEEEQALELRTRDRERKLMKKIAEALQRIEDGSYGSCEETGEHIGLRRLLARPTATLSIEAQERREQRERAFGG